MKGICKLFGIRDTGVGGGGFGVGGVGVGKLWFTSLRG